MQTATSFAPVNVQNALQPGRLYTATETHIFSSNFTNQLRLGYTHAYWATTPGVSITSADESLINFPNPFTAPYMNYPRIGYDNSTLNDGLLYGGGSSGTAHYSSRINEIWDLGESAIWTIKRHTLGFGFDGRTIRYNMIEGRGMGAIQYNGEYSGDGFADSL